MTYLVTALLFFLPFFILPFTNSVFEIPKVVASELAILVVIIIVFSRIKLLRSFVHRDYLVFAGIGLVLLISLLFHTNQATLFGNSFRLQGVILALILLGFALVSTKISPYIPSEKSIVVLLLSEFLLSVIIIGPGDRAIGTLGEPNALATLIIFFFPFTINFKKDDKSTWCVVASASILSLVLIFMTGSRSGFITFVLEIVAIVLMRRISLVKTFAICLVIFIISITLPFLKSDQLYENRSEIWITAFQSGLEQPIFGHGVGSTDQSLTNTIHRVKNNLRGYHVDSSHNIFLDWWVQGGLLGLVFFSFISFADWSKIY